MPPVTAIVGEELPADRKKKRMRLTENTVDDLPTTDRKKKKNKKRSAAVISGADLEAHKAEWRHSSRPPWESEHGAGMDDEKQWPPIWKERIEECPEYEVLAPFLRDPSRYRSSLLEQIRQSRGYDVTVTGCKFLPFSPESLRSYSHISTAVCKYITAQINESAKEHGESYVLDEVQKIVRIPRPHFFYTFTVKESPAYNNIKTVQAYVHSQPHNWKLLVYLKEWRFKP